MKILKIISLGYVSGGAEAGVQEEKSELEQRGHQVKIISSDIGKTTEFFSDVQFKTINANNPLKVLTRIFNPYSFFLLRKVLKQFKPDVVHLHTMEHVSPSVLFLLKKYPTIVSVHGPETFLKSLTLWTLLPQHFKKNEINKESLNKVGKIHYFYHAYLQRYIYKLGFKNVDLFIGISDYITNVIKNEVSPVMTKINFTTLFTYKKIDHYNLLFLGRVEKVKGIEYLIKSMPTIIKKFPSTKLLVVGEGGYLAEMITLSKKLGLEQNIIFVGKIPRQEIERYYHQVCIVIIPSVWPEAFGKVGIEAMSAGRVVIATNIGGIPEWLKNGKTGFLIERNSSEEIAEKVIQLLSNKRLLDTMGKNARLQSEKFSIDKHITEIEKIYLSLIKKYN